MYVLCRAKMNRLVIVLVSLQDPSDAYVYLSKPHNLNLEKSIHAAQCLFEDKTCFPGKKRHTVVWKLIKTISNLNLWYDNIFFQKMK